MRKQTEALRLAANCYHNYKEKDGGSACQSGDAAGQHPCFVKGAERVIGG